MKLLDPSNVNHQRNKRFRNELMGCNKINHRNIIKVLDWGFVVKEDKQCPFYVMPYYQSTLRALIASALEVDKVLPRFVQILDAVECAHLNGIIHRDLKPENILFNPESNTLVLCDFGIAHFSEDFLYTNVETKKTERLANFQYAAPEQRERGGSVDTKADIFSLGLMLNEMFTGKVPAGTGFRRIGQVAQDFGYLDDLVERMMQQDPKARPQSVKEVKNYLIGKKNEFVVVQRLDELKNTVVSESEIDDPLVISPPKLTDVDYQLGEVLFILHPRPTMDWFMTLQRTTPATYTMGFGPQDFQFYREGIISILTLSEPDHVQWVVDIFKRYVGLANNDYKEMRLSQHRQREREKREEIQRQIEAEETRLKLKQSIKL